MSILLFADRREATNIQLFYFNQDFIDYDIFDDYVINLNKNSLNQDFENNNSQFLKLRQETYNRIKKEILSDLFDNIIGVNLPTGIGKTLINLNLALKIKEKIKSSFNYHPKIIYSLPFLSIIDQVDELIKKAFNFKKINLTSNLYISHHYLSKFEYKINNINNIDENIEYLDLLKGELMIENWDSHIVLTTFVKLFETITKNKVSTLMRFYNLISSIVILDEVQNIPYKYYYFLNTIFKALSYYFNNYFILSTEKKEFIFENIKIDIIRLSEDSSVIIGEIKKSSKFIKPAVMQLAFYLYTLKNIIPNLAANLLIPLEKKNIKVELTPELEKELKECIDSITNIIKNEKPPKFKKIVFCEKCAYKFYCFS